MLVALCIARCHGTASSCLEPSSPVCPGWGAARHEQHPGTVPSSRLGPSRKQRWLHCLGSFCPFANRGPAEALNLCWLQMEETKIRAFSGTSRNEGNFPKRSNPSTSGPRYQTKTKARMKMHKITSGFPKYNKRVKHLHASYTLTVWGHPSGHLLLHGKNFSWLALSLLGQPSVKWPTANGHSYYKKKYSSTPCVFLPLNPFWVLIPKDQMWTRNSPLKYLLFRAACTPNLTPAASTLHTVLPKCGPMFPRH